uniref:MULE transposase domain-containing protein n=1 Tax=Heliothis virescens TaxID=7102 RepID=A0A2A4J092_HELVI
MLGYQGMQPVQQGMQPDHQGMQPDQQGMQPDQQDIIEPAGFLTHQTAPRRRRRRRRQESNAEPDDQSSLRTAIEMLQGVEVASANATNRLAAAIETLAARLSEPIRIILEEPAAPQRGCPVLIVGTTHKQRKFNALCLAVSTTEQKDDFKLVFKSMKDNIQLLSSSAFRPTILVADAAENIQNAFNEEFEETKVHTLRCAALYLDAAVARDVDDRSRCRAVQRGAARRSLRPLWRLAYYFRPDFA